MADVETAVHQGHPAPHRHRFGLGWLLFALFAPPIGWSLHLISNYALASHNCYPIDVPKSPVSPGLLWTGLIAIDVVSLALSAASGLIAYSAWRASREEMAENRSHMIEAGEGRTRFLAVWGLLTSGLFFITVASDSASLWILRSCS
ncbi:conserved membrane protein of unknown function [Bradyrhizobium sp. ORS 285]|uniref:hypothetical protein n=1 Tax=Bradyrhizobium sp. ORS 285 TaxID=115808 RepID=UPI000240732E|nr:hypothetical protein [Bradyrhizobium sp. ORS 285]CCD87268.1 conserved membrane hypothetical protein [Bradyrhizobium sp. ORS 285]SMX57973.1 conserved membrane protein of unknown function [Bradyrhizobium sp. ORS 285]